MGASAAMRTEALKVLKEGYQLSRSISRYSKAR